MNRSVIALMIACLTACAEDEPRENPQVINAVSPRCADNERYVKDVCIALGADDGCEDVGDACIALCDELASCTTVAGTLRAVKPWPVAPDGYCVECAVP